MKQKYKDWIEKNILDTADGLCLEWSGLMTQLFPELTLVEGYVHFKEQEKIGYFWCIDEDFVIVDPTVEQFGFPPSHYVFVRYPKPTGKCKVCGNYTYLGNVCCSVPCYCTADTENRL